MSCLSLAAECYVEPLLDTFCLVLVDVHSFWGSIPHLRASWSRIDT